MRSTTHRVATRLLWACLLLVTVGCGAEEEQDLTGTLADSYDLSYDFVRVRLAPTELTVDYVRTSGEMPVQVMVRRDSREVAGPETINLVEHGAITGISKGAAMPDLTSGTLVFEQYEPRHGSRVKGHFDGKFSSSSGEVTLHGDFETDLEVKM